MSLFTLTVNAHESVLEYRDGTLSRVLEPGRYRVRTRTSYVRLDRREQVGQTAPQDVLTADGVSLKVTAAFLWTIGDPQAYHELAAQPTGVVYLAVQVALREALATLTVEEVLTTGRRAIVEAVTSTSAAAGREVGVDVREVVLKDVILPPDLRSAYAEEITARQRGKAQLEAARAETAALRSLANGAKLLADNPALAKLRLVQALPYGSTLKITVDE
ncbi:MAG TPA: slipin family protein [Nocardioidaceae bacterium]|nr:slipin family protein [Nocardioidaceae bacterium]